MNNYKEQKEILDPTPGFAWISSVTTGKIRYSTVK